MYLLCIKDVLALYHKLHCIIHIFAVYYKFNFALCYIFTLLYDLYHNHVARFVTTLQSLLTEIIQTFLEHWMRGAETDSSWNCFVHFITDLHYWRFKLIQTPKCTTSNRRRPSQLRISDPNIYCLRIISLPRVSMNYSRLSMNALCLWSDFANKLWVN